MDPIFVVAAFVLMGGLAILYRERARPMPPLPRT